MSTGQQKVNIFLKKFLTQQQITTNFLEYLHNLILESHRKLVSQAGIYTYPVIAASTVVDSIDFLTPGEVIAGDGNGPELEADDGHGRILLLDDALRQQVPVPNTIGVKYYCGIRFNYYPSDTEINVRTGVIKWSLFSEAVGELGEPNHLSYHNNQFQIQVDNICNGVSQLGRTIRIWLNVPQSQASGDTYEDVVVSAQSITFEHNGGVNYFDVPNGFGSYFTLGQSLTIDQSPTSPLLTSVTLVGANDSGGTGFTRISVSDDLSAYTVAAGSFVLTGNNVINPIGTLGQGAEPSVTPSDYQIFMYGITVSSSDLRLNEYYAYLLNYTGAGAGNNPTSFDNSDQVQVLDNVNSTIILLEKFKTYQQQRNDISLRGGGQVSYNSGTLDWNDQFEVINPYRGIYAIPAGSISGLVNNDVLYTNIYPEQPVIIDGNTSGEIWIENTSDFNDNDQVIIGDSDSTLVTGYIFGAPGTEKLTIDDGAGTPINLSAFTSLKGAWVQRTNLTIQAEQINQGVLAPATDGTIDSSLLVLGVVYNNTVLFKDGILRLEDGDVGEISNLPSGYNWVNTLTELKDSVIKTIDSGCALIAPKTYTLTETLTIDKNMTMLGFSDTTIISGTLADPILEITVDTSTAGSYQLVEIKNLIVSNLGTGPVITIDNTGATKGMVVIIDTCILQAASGATIQVTHGESGQYIQLIVRDSREQEFIGNIVFETQNNADNLTVSGIKLKTGNKIVFGLAGQNPSSTCVISNSTIDEVEALGSGNAKSIIVEGTYSHLLSREVTYSGQSLAVWDIFNRSRTYEESLHTASGVDVEDEIQLPLDSRYSNVQKKYITGKGDLRMLVNGVEWNRHETEIVGTFDPTSYTSGTGIVLVPDSVDLSNVRREDIFRDADSNEFSILGNVSNLLGSKQFEIDQALTVNVGDGATIFRQDFKEYGAPGDWADRVISRKRIAADSIITFRVEK